MFKNIPPAVGIAIFLLASAHPGAAAPAPAQSEYYCLRDVPLSSITPTGWLRKSLEIQRDGLTGHPEAEGSPFNTPGWACPSIGRPVADSWSMYEQNAYWVDGALRLGVLLNDKDLIARAGKQLQYVLDHPSPDGKLGPSFMITRWPLSVLFRAMMIYYDTTGDPAILEAIHRHYLANQPVAYSKTAGIINPFALNICAIEGLCWLYEKTGDRRLLDQATQARTDFGKYPPLVTLNRPASGHGVCYMEQSKLPAVLYLQTGDKAALGVAVEDFNKMDKAHMLVDGVPSSSELLSGNGSRSVHETCVICAIAWYEGYLLKATGDPVWADYIERATLNAGMGAITKDFKAFQYFSSPNQVLATSDSSSELKMSKERMAYRPGHEPACCGGNINRMLPNYAARLWMTDGKGALAAVVYGPSTVKFPAGADNTEIVVAEKTNYPFSGDIDFEVQSKAPVHFPLWLRIPGWCDGAQVSVNGTPEKIATARGTFAILDRTFAPGDQIRLRLPMPVRVSHWPENGVVLERGPLVFSLPVEATKVATTTGPKASKDFPAWDMTPASPWNYALALSGATPADAVKVETSASATDDPWNNPPVSLIVPARRVAGWELEKGLNTWGKKDAPGVPVTITPALPQTVEVTGPVENIRLVPLGCTLLRLTIFPVAPPPTVVPAA